MHGVEGGVWCVKTRLLQWESLGQNEMTLLFNVRYWLYTETELLQTQFDTAWEQLVS